MSLLNHSFNIFSVLILIDEYNVPPDKAHRSGYYDEMAEFIRRLFEQVLKASDSLYSQCLPDVSKYQRSISAGLNNFNVYTVNDAPYNEFFGCTDTEVRKMPDYCGFMEHYNTIKERYGDYRFSDLEIYCPWDVVSYCHALKMNPSITHFPYTKLFNP